MIRPRARRHAHVRTVALLTIMAAVLAAGLFAATTLLAEEAVPSVDGVASSSHPNPTRWYNDPYPAFHWLPCSGVDGYSWSLTRVATSQPDGLLEAFAFPSYGLGPVEYSTGAGPSGVAIGDLDGDGFNDLVVANRSTATVSVRLGVGDGSLGPEAQIAAGWEPTGIALADLDGDADLDVVTTDYWRGAVCVLLGNGDGTFAPWVDYAAGASPHRFDVGDVDRDGVLDIVVANQGAASIGVLLGIGGGSFATATHYPTGSWPSDVRLADLDGDQDLDAVTANFMGNSVSVLLGIGDGTFGAATDHAAGLGTHGIALVDLDADGDVDAVTANYEGSVSVLPGDGAGGLAAATTYEAGSGPNAVAAGDVNGDGAPDVVTANMEDDTLSVLLGRGDGALLPRTDYPTGDGPCAVALGDFDGDQKQDVAAADYDGDAASVLLNTVSDTVATFGPRSDGTWYFHVRAASDLMGATTTLPVNIDTTRPATKAPASTTVKRYATAALKYRVNDARPGSPTATVTIKIKNSKGVVVKTLNPGVKAVNTTYLAKFVCKLAVGPYRYYVYGKDQAGNTQITIGSNKLVVK
ncbi:MAG TPA: VCBS repeat-containing protein [Thermoleophilia bacterium]|nr:VCBS repeat-containing protein [Thermoleophilia bacterium]